MKRWLKPSTPTGLMLIVVLMFGFGFMLVPLYDVFCEITGLNGKTQGPYQGEVNAAQTENQRTVTIQFVANRNDNLPWLFAPEQEEIQLQIGERKQTTFRVSNTYDQAVVAQAIPSVSPARAADYLNKVECFCFQRQPLEAGQAKDFPLVFFIDPDLPADISKLTLSYTLFDITNPASARTH
ncbi:MAG: cytochrome c oxidase assembly protein [Methylophaga sp.]